MDKVCPVAFSNAGPILLSGPVIEPPAMTFSSAALAVVDRTEATIAAASNPFMVVAPSIRYQHVGDKLRLAHGLADERRALLEPGARRGRAPQRLPARIAQGPAQRLVVVVHREIVAGVQLE